MPTIKDVAAAARVSVASVSRAINAPSTVSADTLKRINAAIRKLGFAPNKIARSLKVQTSKSVAVMVPDISNPFHVKIIKGAESVLAAAGYTLFIMDSEENAEKETRSLRDLLDRQIDGLVYIPVLTNTGLPPILSDRQVPLVFVDRYLGTGNDCIRGNSGSGISFLIKHLSDSRRHRVALVSGTDESLVGRERNEAYYREIRRNGLAEDPALVRHGDFTVDAGYMMTRELLNSGVDFDALVATSNLLGIGALKALRTRGGERLTDIELAVFDEIGELVDLPVLHVRQPAFEMGAQATRFLLERIAGDNSPARTVLFEPVLVIPVSSSGRV